MIGNPTKHLAMPLLDATRRAMLRHAALQRDRPLHAWPCLTDPRYPSQTSFRQSGGIIPNAIAFAIMPRCR